MIDRPTPMRCQATALLTVDTKQVLMDIVGAHASQQTLVLVGGLLKFASMSHETQAAWIEMAKQEFLKGT